MTSTNKSTTIVINSDYSTSPREHIIPIKIEKQKHVDDYDSDNDESDDDNHKKRHDSSYRHKYHKDSHDYDESKEEKRKNIKIIKVSQGTQQNADDDADDHRDYSLRIPSDKSKSINRSSSVKQEKSKNQNTSSSSSSSSSDSDSDRNDDNHKKRQHHHHKQRKNRHNNSINLVSLDKGDRKHSIEILNTTIEGYDGDNTNANKNRSLKSTSFKKQHGKNRSFKGDINNNDAAITTQPGKSILKASSPQPVASSTPIPQSDRPLSPSNVIRKKPSTGSQIKSWLTSSFALCCACAPFECECCRCCYWKCFRCQQCFCQCCNQKCC